MSFVASCILNEPTLFLITLFSTHTHLNYHHGRWDDGGGGTATRCWRRHAAQGNNLKKYVFKIFKSKLQASLGMHNSMKIWDKIFPKGGTTHTFILVEQLRTLGENRQTSNVQISVLVYSLVFVIMRRIHSQYFQIFRKDEYWRMPYVKVSSRDYSSIYTRMAENITNIWYSPILSHAENRRMCRSALTLRII